MRVSTCRRFWVRGSGFREMGKKKNEDEKKKGKGDFSKPVSSEPGLSRTGRSGFPRPVWFFFFCCLGRFSWNFGSVFEFLLFFAFFSYFSPFSTLFPHLLKIYEIK